jgi:hypothetical protein
MAQDGGGEYPEVTFERRSPEQNRLSRVDLTADKVD